MLEYNATILLKKMLRGKHAPSEYREQVCDISIFVISDA